MALVPTGKPVDRAERRSFADHVSLKGSRLSTRFFLSLFFFFFLILPNQFNMLPHSSQTHQSSKEGGSPLPVHTCAVNYIQESRWENLAKLQIDGFTFTKKGIPSPPFHSLSRVVNVFPEFSNFKSYVHPTHHHHNFLPWCETIKNWKKNNNNKRNNWTST